MQLAGSGVVLTLRLGVFREFGVIGANRASGSAVLIAVGDF